VTSFSSSLEAGPPSPLAWRLDLLLFYPGGWTFLTSSLEAGPPSSPAFRPHSLIYSLKLYFLNSRMTF
jgi:hypothetical protein